jgi:F1F0 ATPase subunit 2
MKSETLPLLYSLIAGGGLGLVFFGGLWWTILRAVPRDGTAAKPSVFWFLGSHFLRVFITLAGFYFVASGDWKRLLLCLAGFLLGRAFVTWFTRSPRQNRKGEATHAS